MQRNNYALQIKRDLIEKKTSLKIPNFSKMVSRDIQGNTTFCLNKEFYNNEKPKKHIPNIWFMTKARDTLKQAI